MSYTLQIRFRMNGKNLVHRSKWTWRPSKPEVVDCVRRLRNNQPCSIEVGRVILTKHEQVLNYEWPGE